MSWRPSPKSARQLTPAPNNRLSRQKRVKTRHLRARLRRPRVLPRGNADGCVLESPSALAPANGLRQGKPPIKRARSARCFLEASSLWLEVEKPASWPVSDQCSAAIAPSNKMAGFLLETSSAGNVSPRTNALLSKQYDLTSDWAIRSLLARNSARIDVTSYRSKLARTSA